MKQHHRSRTFFMPCKITLKILILKEHICLRLHLEKIMIKTILYLNTGRSLLSLKKKKMY